MPPGGTGKYIEVVQQFIHGKVGEADLAALRVGGTKFSTQYGPEDFK